MIYLNAQAEFAERTRGRSDLRATVRYRCAPATFGRVSVPDFDDLELQRAWLNDLSCEGVGMIMIRPVPVGHAVSVRLRNPVSNEPILLQAHVMHATPVVAGEWLVGCKLDSPLTLQELEELLS